MLEKTNIINIIKNTYNPEGCQVIFSIYQKGWNVFTL